MFSFFKRQSKVYDLPRLRGQVGVFEDRSEAGGVLADMLEEYRGSNAIVLGIPSGGAVVAAEVARCLALPLELAVVSKITPRCNSEVGFGAVAFDGTVRLDESAIRRMGVRHEDITEGVERARRRVNRRLKLLRRGRGELDLKGRTAIIVDDGIAAGVTMNSAIDAVKSVAAKRVVVAVPTAHDNSVTMIVQRCDAVYCANIRGGWDFSVADAYRRWRDVDEQEVLRLLKDYRHAKEEL